MFGDLLPHVSGKKLIFPGLLPRADRGKDIKDPKPFEFLKPFEGCRKGKSIKRQNEIKKYLENFGYNKNVDGGDVFDDHLEAVVKTYQLN
ncbi:hypothetical protein GIB67_013944 [Kingdonia uniflora]|uniref:Peptidoglycan binding-like domain-containing protein n=1 Tax=Kingdonia uniflora TaxID=39325 RepID=A0A7J7LD96_9MAGN|nr:hypothetical protein GIB67_013944 [Kingdonia uniflora]